MQTEILFEDRDILVAYKPAGLPVQTSQVGRQDMESELKNYLKQPFLGIVHRLDQPVEGVLVFGKNPKATAALNRQLSQSDFCKEYLAVVYGSPTEHSKELVDYIIKDGNRAKICTLEQAGNEQAKRAVLQYEQLKTTKLPEMEMPVSLLQITLKTGRFHQIRAQLSNMGNPILGDNKYGTQESMLVANSLSIKNVALCAYRLTFCHPVTKKTMEYNINPKNLAFSFF